MEYNLCDSIELDEGYFSSDNSLEADEVIKRGVGSQKKTKVLVMANAKKLIDDMYHGVKGKVPTTIS